MAAFLEWKEMCRKFKHTWQRLEGTSITSPTHLSPISNMEHFSTWMLDTKNYISVNVFTWRRTVEKERKEWRTWDEARLQTRDRVVWRKSMEAIHARQCEENRLEAGKMSFCRSPVEGSVTLTMLVCIFTHPNDFCHIYIIRSLVGEKGGWNGVQGTFVFALLRFPHIREKRNTLQLLSLCALKLTSHSYPYLGANCCLNL